MKSTAQSSTANYHFKDASARRAYFEELEEAGRYLDQLAAKGTVLKDEKQPAWLRAVGCSQDTGQRGNSGSVDEGITSQT